jgi:hypothetical protein
MHLAKKQAPLYDTETGDLMFHTNDLRCAAEPASVCACSDHAPCCHCCLLCPFALLLRLQKSGIAEGTIGTIATVVGGLVGEFLCTAPALVPAVGNVSQYGCLCPHVVG